jgi:hypothetical protein
MHPRWPGLLPAGSPGRVERVAPSRLS